MHTLPVPSAIAKAHCDQLLGQIVAKIAAQGPISFADYMHQCLYAPGLGYYSAGSRKFGQAGDFVTAPEISPLFSHCLARQCAQVLTDVSGGDILELGAGSGKMALEILRELERLNTLPARYLILEVSADLRARQQDFIEQQAPEYLKRITWLDALPDMPIKGVILANEVIDAMPINKFHIDNGVKECLVDYQNEKLIWKIGQPRDPNLTKCVQDLQIDFANGYESEINLMLSSWVASLSDVLAQGVMLFIDYGFPQHEFYHHDRHMGTIMCHYRHRAHQDPFFLPGLQDVTAHVDFTAVAKAGVQAGCDVLGYTHQAGFLLGCGLAQMLDQNEDEVARFQRNQQIKQLTLPSEMGELFKVIALAKNHVEPLIGFALLNQLERLG